MSNDRKDDLRDDRLRTLNDDGDDYLDDDDRMDDDGVEDGLEGVVVPAAVAGGTGGSASGAAVPVAVGLETDHDDPEDRDRQQDEARRDKNFVPKESQDTSVNEDLSSAPLMHDEHNKKNRS